MAEMELATRVRSPVLHGSPRQTTSYRDHQTTQRLFGMLFQGSEFHSSLRHTHLTSLERSLKSRRTLR